MLLLLVTTPIITLRCWLVVTNLSTLENYLPVLSYHLMSPPPPTRVHQQLSTFHRKSTKEEELKKTEHTGITPTPKTRARFTNMSRPIVLAVTTLYLGALLFLHIHSTICNNGVSALGLRSLKGNEDDAIVRRGCSTSTTAKRIGDCHEEPEMESEISRRVLVMQKNFISYETLKRDMVPCSKPGASYYDCHARAANPYNRGCEVITRCARDANH